MYIVVGRREYFVGVRNFGIYFRCRVGYCVCVFKECVLFFVFKLGGGKGDLVFFKNVFVVLKGCCLIRVLLFIFIYWFFVGF